MIRAVAVATVLAALAGGAVPLTAGDTFAQSTAEPADTTSADTAAADTKATSPTERSGGKTPATTGPRGDGKTPAAKDPTGEQSGATPEGPSRAPSPDESPATAEAKPDPAWANAEQARLKAEAAKLERLQAEQEAETGADDAPASLWPTFLRTVVMLSAVCLLAYLLLGKLMPKLLQIEPPTASRRLLKVVDRLAIDQKRSVMILQLGDEYFLVGAAEQNITLMSKLDAEQLERLLAEPVPTAPGLAKLGELLVRRQAKGS